MSYMKDEPIDLSNLWQWKSPLVYSGLRADPILAGFIV